MTYLPSLVKLYAKDLEIYEIKNTTKFKENVQQQCPLEFDVHKNVPKTLLLNKYPFV